MFVLVVMQMKTRRIEIAGITASPNSAWVRQMARNLTDQQDGFLRNATHLFVDRDTKFLPLRDFLENCTDIEPVVLPPRETPDRSGVELFRFEGWGAVVWPAYAESITTVPLCFGLFAFWRTRCHGRWQSADPHVRQRSLKGVTFSAAFPPL